VADDVNESHDAGTHRLTGGCQQADDEQPPQVAYAADYRGFRYRRTQLINVHSAIRGCDDQRRDAGRPVHDRWPPDLLVIRFAFVPGQSRSIDKDYRPVDRYLPEIVQRTSAHDLAHGSTTQDQALHGQEPAGIAQVYRNAPTQTARIEHDGFLGYPRGGRIGENFQPRSHVRRARPCSIEPLGSLRGDDCVTALPPQRRYIDVVTIGQAAGRIQQDGLESSPLRTG
jgi:hypothetical protein